MHKLTCVGCTNENSSGDARERSCRGMGLKLKPDTYDGSVPLREFLSQFNLIARANGWGKDARTLALISCLRGKARSILDCVQNIQSLDYAEGI